MSLIKFGSSESIGKTTQQINACTAFMFKNISPLKASLAKAVKTQQAFKLVETIERGKSHFHFFVPPSQQTAKKVNNERPSKIRKTV